MSLEAQGDHALGTLPQFIVDNSIQARNTQSWHPKLTPYRVAIISTTLCLGTAKAVLTQQGRSFAPITLEWIMSVVLMLVFQISSDYDSGGRAPSFLSWFFTFDCISKS
ncbi:hypothetical protein GALMADRAFT_232064 [Galerina marginata CBS 339.88]|uniref:Uncharacterized protein n=1 Tax=Galerina marginata (strain CBS 339.88) TaxID=685588 RepID=A0A067SI50_GALM3|nr:hypothetical protein GALMADRAFT_232064 [Galerina marginata CBS 339.88]